MTNDDEILEHALNFGIFSAAKRFNTEPCSVRNLVVKFSKETCLHDKCDCQESQENGFRWMMCPQGFCNKGLNRRIDLK